jgi:hypothetical protein
MLQFLAHVSYQKKSAYVSIRCQRKSRTLVLAHAAVLRSRLVLAQVSIRQHTSAYVSIRCQQKSRTLVLAHAAFLRSRLVLAQVSIRQRQQTSVFVVSENQEHLSWLMLQFFAHVSLFANLFLCDWHMLHFITLRAKSPARKKKFIQSIFSKTPEKDR